MRRCGRCGLWKGFEEFAWRRIQKGQRDNYCRPCRSDYKKEHYAANKQRYIANAAGRKRRLAQENTAKLFAYFADHACVDCGEDDPIVLEFDHLAEKEFLIARAMRERTWAEIETEIEKCDVVCASCHRRRTATRGGWIRALVAEEREDSGLIAAAQERARRLTSMVPRV